QMTPIQSWMRPSGTWSGRLPEQSPTIVAPFRSCASRSAQPSGNGSSPRSLASTAASAAAMCVVYASNVSAFNSIFSAGCVINRGPSLTKTLDASRLRPLRPASDDGAEFLDQAAAALGSLGGIAEFEGEAGHGTEIWGRIALVQVIEQGGANIVDGTD